MRLAAAVLVLLTSTALAQPGATQPVYGPPPQPTYPPPQPTYSQPPPVYAPQPYAPAYQPPPAAYAQPVRPLKSESTARWLAIGATAAGIGTMLVAAEDESEGLALAGVALTLIGPSAGHIYAGEHGHAIGLSLLRAGGLATMILGAVQMHSSYDCIDYCYDDYDNDEGEGMMWIGGAVLVGATLYDFYDASRAARRTNEKHGRALAITPMMMSSNGQRSPGVALAGSF